MTSTKRLMLGLGLIVAAGYGGYWLGTSRYAGDRGAAKTHEIEAAELGRLREENQRLRTKIADATRTQANSPKVERTAGVAGTDNDYVVPSSASLPMQLAVLAEVQTSKLATVRLPILGRDGKLSPNFAKVFALTSDEQGTLQEIIDQARQKADALAIKSMKVQQNDGTMTVTIAPFEAGADLYDGVMDSFAQILGPERAGAMVSLVDQSFSNAFYGFGAQHRTLTISREASPTGDGPGIVVRDMRKGGPSTGTTVIISKLSAGETDRFAREYPWLVPYVDQISQLEIKSAPPPRGDSMAP